MKFTDRMRSAREQKGLTQEQLAHICGTTARTIQRYESGASRPKAEVVQKIAKALDVSVDALLGTEGILVTAAAESGGSKAAREVEELTQAVVGLFAGGELPQKDRDAMMKAIFKAYQEGNKLNRKYTPQKYKKDN